MPDETRPGLTNAVLGRLGTGAARQWAAGIQGKS